MDVRSGLGFIVGSVVANALGSWRWGLRVTPILGAISVLLVLIVVQEPKRGVAEGSKLKPTSYWDDVKYLVKKYLSSLFIILNNHDFGNVAKLFFSARAT